MGSELYQAVGEGDKIFMYGAEEEGIGGNVRRLSLFLSRRKADILDRDSLKTTAS